MMCYNSETASLSMFIKKDEFDRRCSIEHNLVARLKLASPVPADENNPITKFDASRFHESGIARDKPKMTNDVRAVIATTAIIAGAEVAAEIGEVSVGHAKMLANGSYSQAKDPEQRERENAELRESIYRGLGEIREAAREKLLGVLNLINDESMEAIPIAQRARAAAQMANQLSSVIDRTINKGENLVGERSTHLHLYAPETRPLAAFNIKQINAAPANVTSTEVVSE